MLAKTASATEAYTAWVASADTPADRRLLAGAVHAADDTLGGALGRVQERWGNDPAQWLTFGMTLAMSQRIRPRSAARSTRQNASLPDRPIPVVSVRNTRADTAATNSATAA